MRGLVVTLMLVLAGCNRHGGLDESRDRALLMIANAAPTADICAETTRNAKAALDQLNAGEYRYWLRLEKDACATTDAKPEPAK